MSNVGWPGGDASVMANAIANSKPSIDEFVTRVLRGNVAFDDATNGSKKYPHPIRCQITCNPHG